jgi:hypothetical protein
MRINAIRNMIAGFLGALAFMSTMAVGVLWGKPAREVIVQSCLAGIVFLVVGAVLGHGGYLLLKEMEEYGLKELEREEAAARRAASGESGEPEGAEAPPGEEEEF